MIIAALLTVALLLFVPVMLWKCWNLPPVPIMRWWAIGFGGASLAWAVAHWKAEFWKKKCEELEAKFQSLPKQSQSHQLRLRKFFVLNLASFLRDFLAY